MTSDDFGPFINRKTFQIHFITKKVMEKFQFAAQKVPIFRILCTNSVSCVFDGGEIR